MDTRKRTQFLGIGMVSAALIAVLAFIAILAAPGASANDKIPFQGGTPHTETGTAQASGTVQTTGTAQASHTVQASVTAQASVTEHGTETGTPHPELTGTAVSTFTPAPIATRELSFDPRLEFEDVHAGVVRSFQFTLRNSAASAATVNFAATSQLGWTVQVAPSSAPVAAGGSVLVNVDVTAPADASGALDTVTLVGTDGVHTASAAMVLLLEHHNFSDLAPTDYFYNPVQYLSGTGAVGGYADGTFRPANTVTRAQFAKMLVAGMGWSLVNPATPHFSDVAPGSTFYAYIETAVAHGALGGYADGTFKPASAVTRAQLAKLIVVSRNWTVQTPAGAHFSDVTSTDWSYGYVETAVQNGILGGYADGTYRPNAPATRAQVAKILANGLVLHQDR